MDTWVVSTFWLWVLLLIHCLYLGETVRMYPNFYFLFGPCMFLMSPCRPWVKWNRFIQKKVWQILDKWKIEPLCDVAIVGLGIYPKEMKTGPWGEICTPTFVAAFSTAVKAWKHPVSISRWVGTEDVMCAHRMAWHSALRKKGIQPFVTIRMDLQGIILNDKSQTEKNEVYTVLLVLCVISKRKNNQILRNRQHKRGLPGVGE